MKEQRFDTGDYMIAWDLSQDHPRIEVGPWPDRTGWSNGYPLTTGFCCDTYQALTSEQRAVRLVYLAAGMMFEGMPPADVLREFDRISEWRDMAALMPEGRFERAFREGHPFEWSPHHPE